MKKYILFIMGMLCASVSLYAQSPPGIKALTISDTVPDITLSHILNYKDTTAKLSDFRGKPVILDFFATWCGACIGALPKLDSLQQAFGDSLQMLVIDYEPADKVKKFLENNKVGQNVSLPFVTGDSLLSYAVFPHRTVPQEVWLDADGVVQAITLAEYVTAGNLRDLYHYKPLHLPLKKDMMHFNNKKPLFVDGNGGSAGQIRFRSTLAGYIDGLGPKSGRHKDSLTKGLYEINRPILALYSVAMQYSTARHGIGNRVILEVKNKAHYINDGSMFWDQWARENDYSYELIAPVNTPDSVLRQWMLQDLNRWLHMDARWEKRRVSCWALVVKSKNDARFKTKGGKPELKYGGRGAFKIYHNEPLGKVVETWNEQMPSQPPVPLILDETGYTGNVDLALKVKDLHNIPALRKVLQPYGLDIIPVQRNLKMFVITEKGYRPPSGQAAPGMNE